MDSILIYRKIFLIDQLNRIAENQYLGTALGWVFQDVLSINILRRWFTYKNWACWWVLMTPTSVDD